VKKTIIFIIFLFSCVPKYKEFKTFQKDNIKISILTETGNFKIGNNNIQVIVNPKENLIKEVFLYMPPTNETPEKRILAKIQLKKDGLYEGYINISEKGIWDFVIILNDGSVISERIPIGNYEQFGF